jgi:hypothetical protein
VDFLFGIEIGYFYIGKVVCNEKCKHDLGRVFFSIVTRKNYLLHPTSSGFELMLMLIEYFGLTLLHA